MEGIWMKNNEEKITTIYYIRHSVKLSNNMINTYMTNQSKLLQNEKIVLSVNEREELNCLVMKKNFKI